MYIDQNTWIRTYHVGKPNTFVSVSCRQTQTPKGCFFAPKVHFSIAQSWVLNVLFLFFDFMHKMAVWLKGKIHGFIQILFDGYHTTRYNDFTFYNYFKTIRSIFVLLKKWLYAKTQSVQCFQDLLRLFHLLNFWPYCICATAIV